MEIGDEISQKIRSAIKAKLVDLGAYVDDELPDYIMVMVANKKNVAQMTEDLNLFLGSNTGNFTAWLSGLLDKLQSITADSPEGATTQASPVPEVAEQELEKAEDAGAVAPTPIVNTVKEPQVQEKNEEKSRRKSGEKSRKHSTERTGHPEKLEEASSEKAEATTEKLKAEEPKSQDSLRQQNAPAATPKTRKSSEHAESSKPSDIPAPSEEPELVLRVEDDFEEERQAEARITEEKKKEAASKRPSASSSSRTRSTSSSSRSGKGRDRVSSQSHSSASGKPRSVSVSDRKRKGPSSAIGAVVTHDIYDNYEYDPKRPAVGTVASVVKVTDRKSSVPPALQANRSLLMKAMNDAHSSIERHSRRMAEAVETVMKKSGSSSRHKSRSIHSRLGRTRTSAPSSSISRSSGRVHKEAEPKQERSIQLFSRSKREEVIRQFKSGLDSPVDDGMESEPAGDSRSVSSTEPEVVADRVSPVSQKSPSPALAAEAEEAEHAPTREDGRHIEIQRAESEHESEPEQDDNVSESSQPSPGTLSLSASGSPGTAESSPTEAAPASPKFVVTLDGVEASLLQKKIRFDVDDSVLFEEEDEDVLEVQDTSTEEIKAKGSNIVKVKPQLQFQEHPPPPYRQQQHHHPQYPPQPQMYEQHHYQAEYGYQQQQYPPPPQQQQQQHHYQTPQQHQYQAPQYQQQQATAEGAYQTQQSPMSQVHPVEIAPVTINLGEPDEEEEDYDTEQLPTKKAKLTERCRFWPNCKNGEACPYHHPSSPCRFFPKCQYGDKCVNVHPTCRFDAQCTRPNCPYQHTSKKPPISPNQIPIIVQPISVPMYQVAKPAFTPKSQKPSHPSQVTCRFYPRCTNMNCPFNHPTPCRYGASCSQRGRCTFTHPDLPSVDQLRWVAGKSETSSVMSEASALSAAMASK